MRVRPFFWILLATACIIVLTFAGVISAHKVFPMYVHIDRIAANAASSDATVVHLHLTDANGLPIEQANLVPSAYMTNMHMNSELVSTQDLGQGAYLALFYFAMPGPWHIDIIAHAHGFDVIQHSIALEVV